MRRIFLVSVVAASTLAWPAAAQTSYPDFSSTSGLQLNGNAAQNGNKLRLTEALAGQAGSAFSLNTISLGANASFSTFFSFEILNRGDICCGIIGADGLTFTMNTTSNTVGSAGGGIGYDGIPNSVAVEFDTFDNGEPGGSNHVGINTEGSATSIAGSGFVQPDFDNGEQWWVWVDYNGVTQGLEVRWAETASRPGMSMLSHTLNLAEILGDTDVYVGFTSATGWGYGEHNILSWNFVNTFQEGGAPIPSTVPEPGTIFLMATGLGVIVIGRRLRRHRS